MLGGMTVEANVFASAVVPKSASSADLDKSQLDKCHRGLTDISAFKLFKRLPQSLEAQGGM